MQRRGGACHGATQIITRHRVVAVDGIALLRPGTPDFKGEDHASSVPTFAEKGSFSDLSVILDTGQLAPLHGNLPPQTPMPSIKSRQRCQRGIEQQHRRGMEPENE